MDYRETEPPEALRPLVRAGWTLDAGGDSSAVLRHVAMPDGCIEIIRRVRGRSAWGGDQPECFVAGLLTAPAPLELSGDSRFVALRLWPWAWNALAGTPSPRLIDRWQDLAQAAPGFAMPESIGGAFEAMARAELEPLAAALGEAILGSRSVAALSAATGLPRRRLQRWFEREIGLPPRRYLRLLRFQETLAGLQGSPDSLAARAAEHGFADQAHMAREFRVLARAPAGAARRRAKGPFL